MNSSSEIGIPIRSLLNREKILQVFVGLACDFLKGGVLLAIGKNGSTHHKTSGIHSKPIASLI